MVLEIEVKYDLLILTTAFEARKWNTILEEVDCYSFLRSSQRAVQAGTAVYCCGLGIISSSKLLKYFLHHVWLAGGSGRGEARTRMVVTRRPERGWFQGILPSNRHLFDW